ncbi:MAG: VOC family protein [Rhodococcus sp.]|nr:VOC family protein [Rhodococcus sp. (in: high G+C Gram-positive bacteria)]
MGLKLEMITADSTDPGPLAQWWAEQTGGSSADVGEGEFFIVTIPGGPNLGFQKVEVPTPGKNRLHLDLSADDLESEVIRLVAAGATEVEHRGFPGFKWVTLIDPDGNEFCVAGSHSE